MASLTLAQGEVPVPVPLRLFLPDEWVADLDCCARAGVPEAEAVARAKGEVALAGLDRVRAAGARFGCVLADAGYGASAAFRHALDERGLLWAVGIARNQKVYGTDVQRAPLAGRARKPVPDQEPRAAEDALAALPWRRVTWREGAKGKLQARLAAVRIRVADGATWANNRRLPGKEAWLVGEWRSSGERKYCLANLPPRTSVRALAAAIKARWVCEQAHQQLKGELGLGHFESRPWTGLHRHALMYCIAYAFVQHLRLAGQTRTGPGENKAPCSGTATITRPARGAPGRGRQAGVARPGSPGCSTTAGRTSAAHAANTSSTVQAESAKVVIANSRSCTRGQGGHGQGVAGGQPSPHAVKHVYQVAALAGADLHTHLCLRGAAGEGQRGLHCLAHQGGAPVQRTALVQLDVHYRDRVRAVRRQPKRKAPPAPDHHRAPAQPDEAGHGGDADAGRQGIQNLRPFSGLDDARRLGLYRHGS